MSFSVIDRGWDKVIENALHADCSTVRVICPFIQKRTAERLLQHGKATSLQVITRFDLDDCCAGVNDITALRLLHTSGASIRGVKHLHTKLYLLGRHAVITSANLTEAALFRNHEFGFDADDAGIVAQCEQYFNNLWSMAGPDVSAELLADWEREINNHLAFGAHRNPSPRLGDKGVDAGFSSHPIVSSGWLENAEQAFVKFFGKSDNRAPRSLSILEEVEESECHWACTYPKTKRPRQVRDGALMFMGRLVKDPNDILIYGRAIGMHYTEGRDEASTADIQRRPWKKDWPRYVRVHDAEFISGTLSNGISLSSLFDALEADASVPTQRNANRGTGNTDPRKAYSQRPALALTLKAAAWLNDSLEHAFRYHGKLSPADLAGLYWPPVPAWADANVITNVDAGNQLSMHEKTVTLGS